MKIFEKTNNDMAGIYIIYESPVQNEDNTNFGVSHLLEHMICRSTDDIEEEYDENCINSNASTGNSNVIFYLTGLSENLNKYKDDFIRRITTYAPTQKDFDIEISIVTQEYNDANSDASFSTYSNFISKHFGMIFSAGTAETLKNLNYDSVMDFKNKYFANPTKIVVVDKNETPIEVVEFESNIPLSQKPFMYTNRDLVPNEKSLGFVFSSHLIPENENSYMTKFIGSMLSYGLKSPLYQKLRDEKGLVYGVGAYQFEIFKNDVMIIYMMSALENKDEIHSTVMEILCNPEKYLTKERFNLLKNNKTIQKKVSEQFKFENAHVKYLDSERKNKSVFKNLDNLVYDDVITYYNKYLNPNSTIWVFENQKDLLV